MVVCSGVVGWAVIIEVMVDATEGGGESWAMAGGAGVVVCPRRLVRVGVNQGREGLRHSWELELAHKPGFVWTPKGGSGSVIRLAFVVVVPVQTHFLGADLMEWATARFDHHPLPRPDPHLCFSGSHGFSFAALLYNCHHS